MWKEPAVLAVLLILLFTILAWTQRFFLDDAFISLRYASNLAHGHGLVFNPGDVPVEGYTNFLWVLILAIPILAGIDPVTFSFILGILLFGAALGVQYHLATRVTGEPLAGASAVLVLGGLHTFRTFATGGMETMLQTLLILLVFWTGVEIIGGKKAIKWRLIALSTLAGLSFLTRMDSLLLVSLPMGIVAVLILRHRMEGRQAIKLSCLFGPFVLLSVPWLAFKILYYGAILPNTYYLKIPEGYPVTNGLFYLHHFLASYFLYAAIPLILFAILKKRRTIPPDIWIMAAICLLWTIYLVRVGGDFMEYRFMVPVLPFLMTMVVWAAWRTTGSYVWRGVMVAVVLAGSVHHKATYRAVSGGLLPESTRQLELHLTDEGDAWISTGKRLGKLFYHAKGEPVTIATTAAGAIPYYSRLRTVDMVGLNDPWIAHNGLIVEGHPSGHFRAAPVTYLREQGVHLILGHPGVYDTREDPAAYLNRAINLATFNMRENLRQLGPRVRMIGIPVLPGRDLVAVYLTEHPYINDLIAKGILRSYQVDLTYIEDGPNLVR